MKTVKKLTAILLSIALLTALFILPAAAEEAAPIELPKPAVTVTAADGDIVNELALDFTPDDAAAPLPFDSTDLDKAITLYVYRTLGGGYASSSLTLNPKAYDAATGVLTVWLTDVDGNPGFKLHDAQVTVNGELITLFSFRLQFPEGLLTGSEGLCSAASECDCGELHDVPGLPVRTLDELSFPTWPIDLYNRIADKTNSKVIRTIAAVMAVTPIMLFRWSSFRHVFVAVSESIALYNHVDPNYLQLISKLFK